MSDPLPTDPERTHAAKILGKLGGMSGTGEMKRRDPSHYHRLSEMRRVKKLKKQLGISE